MKKKLILGMTVSLLAMSLLVGCGASATSDVSNDTEQMSEESANTLEQTTTSEPTETAHTHIYTETITTEATCETDGEATYTCECGDTYTEPITATGHIFETYASNNDATYLADGTETATCNTCDVTDTRTEEGSMLAYTYTDMDATMYAQQTVNVRSMPSTDGEKLGGLSTNDEVKITGQCVETSWYRIEYDGNTAYVSNSYLGNDKVVVEQPKTEAPAQSTSSGGYNIVLKSGYSWVDTTVSSYDEACAVARAFGYDLWQFHDDGNGNIWCYAIVSHGGDNRGTYDTDFDNMANQCFAHSGGYKWGNHLNTKDGFIHIPASNGMSWSIGSCVSD